MTLTETIPMMTSNDYRERFKAEYYQLKIRASKLHALIREQQIDSAKIILERQLNQMLDYLSTLALRAEFEGIGLQED